ncbi:uncharacterized protein B0T23DRAFT_399336 [Neurospora hispaniola]|uniref:Uncharacterized protein n=1 Tax=Neurospora hispaniola TaxID=588809 RepID=A0AAJ0HZJ4_9PEZI|nr:hypothetical protein B0T23DRAFT_399336 [Neurospora hispaniola]
MSAESDAHHMPQLASRGVHFGHVRCGQPTLSQAHMLLAHLHTQVKDLDKGASQNSNLFSFIYVVPNQRSVIDATDYLKNALVGCRVSRNKVVSQPNTLCVVDYNTVSELKAVTITRRTLIVFDLNCGWVTASAVSSLALVLERIKAMFTTQEPSQLAITCLAVSASPEHAWSEAKIQKEFQVKPQDYICDWRRRPHLQPQVVPVVCPNPKGTTQVDWTSDLVIRALTHPNRTPSFEKLVIVCPVSGWPERDAIMARIRAKCDRAIQNQVQQVFWSPINERVFQYLDREALSRSDGRRFTIVFATSDVRFQQPFPSNCQTIYILPQEMDRHFFDPSSSHIVKTQSRIQYHDIISALRVGGSCHMVTEIQIACFDNEPIPEDIPADDVVQPAWGSEIMSTLINLFQHFAYPSQSLLALPHDGFMTCELASRLFRMGLVHKISSGGYALTDRGQRLTAQFRRVPASSFAAAFLLSSITPTTSRPTLDAVLHTVGVLLHFDHGRKTLVAFDPKDQGVTSENAGIVAGWARPLVTRGALYTTVAVRDYLDQNFQPEDLEKPIKLSTGTLIKVAHKLYSRISDRVSSLRKLVPPTQSDDGNQVDADAIERDLLLVHLYNLVHFTASSTVKAVDVVSGIPFSGLSSKASNDDVGSFAFYLGINLDYGVHVAHGMISVPRTVVYEVLKEVFPESKNSGFEELLRCLRTGYPMRPTPMEENESRK